jgi:glycosyltransferase involved in cell wall biosynthesis
MSGAQCRLSVLILAKNEEQNIGDCIKSVAWADEVIVVDDGSADETQAIAKKLGARVVEHAMNGDYAAQRNFAQSVAAGEWILHIDADERVGDELRQNIQKALTIEPAQYSITRRSVAFGKEFAHGVLSPDRVTRLFPRESAQWVGKVHERAECELPKKRLDGYMLHYTYTNWEQYFDKMNRYSTIWAQNAHNNGKCTSYCGAFAHACGGFLKMTFVRLGILEGWLGLALCHMYAAYTLMKYIKLRSMQEK